MPASDVNRRIEAVWGIESPRLIAGLARIVRDVGVAEDLAQEALVAALEQWPESGVVDNPGAWLMGTAKHRAVDRLRRRARRLVANRWPANGVSKVREPRVLHQSAQVCAAVQSRESCVKPTG